MSLTLRKKVFITAALTGSGGTQNKNLNVPRSPQQISEAAIAAAKAGAAVVHCHVRDPKTGEPAREPALYREVTELIRAANVDLVLNLTAGMGGDLVTGPPDAPLPLNEVETYMASATDRVAHIVACRPEICTLDCRPCSSASAS